MLPKRILLVEDREDDVLFLQMALKQCGYDCDLQIKSDGEEAITYLASLQGSAYTKESQIPHLVLLDIKMPKVNGHEVLAWMRQQMQFIPVPVVMLSSSDVREDILKALQ